MYDGFIDLRAHRYGDALADHNSFWPSFTDIMTVVVMIFLLTSVVVIVRNWELVDNLRASILAEQQAAETVRSAAQARERAEQQLVSTQQRIAALHTELDELSSSADRNAVLLAAKEHNLLSARSAIKRLSQNLQSSYSEVESLRARIKQARTEQAELKSAVKTKQSAFVAQQVELRSAESTVAQLGQNLGLAEQRVSSLEQRIEQVRTGRTALQQSLTNRQTDLASANARIEDLSQELLASRQQAQSMSQRIQQAKNERFELRAAFDRQQVNLSSARKKVARFHEAALTRARELRELRQEGVRVKQQSVQTEQKLANLRGNYDTLEVKYNELIQPARSPQGKHVVEVRYDKGPEGYRIGFREPGEEDFRTISRANLESRLDAIKARRAANLYVKIIIPDTSSLSYNEAWSFTNEILSRYDYYYQATGREPDSEAVQ